MRSAGLMGVEVPLGVDEQREGMVEHMWMWLFTLSMGLIYRGKELRTTI